MKNTAPDNLPTVDPLPEDDPTKPGGAAETEDVHFRDHAAGVRVKAVPVLDNGSVSSIPARRSLQPIRVSMTEPKEHPLGVPESLLCIDDVSQWLRVSRAAVLHMVHRRRIPFYRLPGGIRFKATDIEAFLEHLRSPAPSSQPYGPPQDQG